MNDLKILVCVLTIAIIVLIMRIISLETEERKQINQSKRKEDI
jgi:branched-subunit amino acid transport protein